MTRSVEAPYECVLVPVLLLASVLGTGSVWAQDAGVGPDSLLPAPDTEVEGVDGTLHTVRDLIGSRYTIFLFWRERCPWAARYRDRVRSLPEAFPSSEVSFVLVGAGEPVADSSDREDPAYPFPVVYDTNLSFVRAVEVVRVPHATVVDADRTIVYNGAIDDSPSAAARVQEAYLRDAVSALLRGETPAVTSTKTFGCTVSGID